MQPVRELNEQHAHIARHCNDELAKIFRLLASFTAQLNLGEFCDPIYEPRDFVAELFGDVFNRGVGIFNGIVQQRGRNACRVGMELC